MKTTSSLALAAALALTGAAHAATPADTLVVAVPLDGIISFDPAESFEIVSTSTLVNLYQQLVTPDRQDPTRLTPGLATNWRPGSAPKSLVFNLSAAKFASGNPVSADDVIYSFTRVAKLNKTPAFILGELGWTADNIDAQLRKIDDRQVEVRWTSDIGADLALRLLSAAVASIVDSKLVASHASNGDFGSGWLRTHSAGSAAFAIRDYVPHEALILEKNALASAPAKLRRVLLKNVADAGSRRLLLAQGDADVAYGLGADQFDALKKQAGVKVASFPSGAIYYLGFNTQDKQQPALGNPAFWEAARWLVDYQNIASGLLKGQYQVHQSFLPTGFDGALDTTPFHLDVAKAKSILAKGGIKPGTQFTLTVISQPPYTDIAQALQASFAQADIHITLQPVPEAELWGKMRNRDFQSIFIYWGPDYVDPNTNASAFALNVPGGPKTLAWRVGWTIPEISAQTRAAAAESDGAKRRQLYQQLQTELQRSSPYVVTLQGQTQVALRDNVQDARQDIVSSILYFDRVWKK